MWKHAHWDLTIQAEFAKNIFVNGVLASWPVEVNDVPSTSKVEMPSAYQSDIENIAASTTDPVDPFKPLAKGGIHDSIGYVCIGLLIIAVGIITKTSILFAPIGILAIVASIFGKDAS